MCWNPNTQRHLINFKVIYMSVCIAEYFKKKKKELQLLLSQSLHAYLCITITTQ